MVMRKAGLASIPLVYERCLRNPKPVPGLLHELSLLVRIRQHDLPNLRS
jgi:hypothetical protein